MVAGAKTTRNTPSAKIDVPAGAFAAGAFKTNAPVSSCPQASTCAFQAHNLSTLAEPLAAIVGHPTYNKELIITTNNNSIQK
jgi:hypothetical protein